MRSTLRWLFPALLALSLAGCPSADKDEGSGRRLVVLFTTDEHSHLLAVAPEVDDWPLTPPAAGTGALVGGVARRMAILEAERAAAADRGADTITLSSGDFSQGTLASAAWLATSSELVLMSRMGYHAVSLGNHEFDLGPAGLAAAIGTAYGRGALPPLVLTNVYFSATSAADDALAALYGPGNLVAPSRVVTTAQGLRIGIVASMGVRAGTVAGGAPPVAFWPASATTTGQKFGSIVVALQTAVTALRQAPDPVDAVILLGHGGIGPEGGQIGEDEALAGYLTGVDLVVSGHTHLNTPAPRIVYAPGGKPVPVVQAKPYGREVGKVELVFPDDPARPVRLDPAGSEFIPVDDRVLPTTDAGILGELYTVMGYLEAGNPAVPAYPSFLEETLSTVTGTAVTDDGGAFGDLYFYRLCDTTFDVVGLAPGETNAMNLDTDAMLAAANTFYLDGPTAVALQASGPIRGDLLAGATGQITFADLYRVVPLGADPTANPLADPNALPGFPLVRAIIPTAGLRAAFEGTLQYSLLDGDFFVAPSGLVVSYDMTRPAYDPGTASGLGPGWVTYMALVDGSGTVTLRLYDVTDPTLAATAYFAVNPATHVLPVVTTYYVASFASAFGVPLLDGLGQPTTPAEIILRRGDGSAVKDHEALGAYVVEACAANGGFLPSSYDAATTEGHVPRRMIDCTAGCN
ncbi:MAG TPA: metallophosphoesterase [Anaeromyxobacteraceae bacterium]|nr:metallophosphoesterase [Anaeromyxobacteraceae bacterium]